MEANGNGCQNAIVQPDFPCQKLAEMLNPVTMRGEVRLPGKIVGLAVRQVVTATRRSCGTDRR